jgi:hypothetical protein
MQGALEMAIKGGFKEGEKWVFQYTTPYWVVWKNGNGDIDTIPVEKYYMSIDFWKCLCKQIGLNRRFEVSTGMIDEETLECPMSEGKIIESWQYHWQCFIDNISEGKDINQFFFRMINK